MGLQRIMHAMALVVVATTARAEVVYFDPPDITARVLSVPPPFTPANFATAHLDLDDDGVDDFEIGAMRASFSAFIIVDTWIEAFRAGPAVAGDGVAAHQIVPSSPIGFPGQGFQTERAHFMGWGISYSHGQWSSGDTALAGVRFDRAGLDHFAWVRVRIDAPAPDWLPSVTVVDWAWESQPDTPIVAGAVPAPGIATALLAFSLLAPSSRRRTPVQGEAR